MRAFLEVPPIIQTSYNRNCMHFSPLIYPSTNSKRSITSKLRNMSVLLHRSKTTNYIPFLIYRPTQTCYLQFQFPEARFTTSTITVPGNTITLTTQDFTTTSTSSPQISPPNHLDPTFTTPRLETRTT